MFLGKKRNSKIPPKQEAVYGAIADPKDPKYRKAETWETGGIKASEEMEKPSASEIKTIQPPQPKISHPQQGLQTPSATVTKALPSSEEQTPERPFFLGENTPSQNTEKKEEFDVEYHLKRAQDPDRNNLTRSGRALQKHNPKIKGRDNSYPDYGNNPKVLNKKGSEIVKSILEDPSKKVYKQWRKSQQRNIIDVYENYGTGRGIRFTENGQMVGFLEPKGTRNLK